MTDKTIGENWLEVCADLQGQIVSHKVRIEALTAENERLRELISDTGNHWLALVAVHPVRWEGAIDAAMEAACNEIRRLAALRETHHLIPKDQEPVAYLQEHERGERVLRFQPMDRAAPQFGWTETPLFAPEKRHD